jgi:F0F1-type ATP synthase alpha subunit
MAQNVSDDFIKTIKSAQKTPEFRVLVSWEKELSDTANFFCLDSSELDADTKEKLAQGERIKEVLKQPQYKPMPVEYQVIIIYAATKKYLIDVEVDDIMDFEKGLFNLVTLEAVDKKVKMNRTGKCKLKRYEIKSYEFIN